LEILAQSSGSENLICAERIAALNDAASVEAATGEAKKIGILLYLHATRYLFCHTMMVLKFLTKCCVLILVLLQFLESIHGTFQIHI